MSVTIDFVRHKLDTLRAQLRREDLAPLDRGILVAQRAIDGLGLARALDVRRHHILELRTPPTVSRGFRDLVVRAADARDVRAIADVKDTEPRLVEERLRRGDLAYVGVLDGRILCHAFFHRGPTPFTEDTATMAPWALDADTYWSFDAATTPDTRASGVFVKLFQTCLTTLFVDRGAARVRCRVDVSNTASLALHVRLGFQELGQMLTVATPLANVVHWMGPSAHTWWLRRRSDTAVAFPP